MNELEKFLKFDYEKWKDRPYLHEMLNNEYTAVTFGEFIENINYLGTYFVEYGYKDKNIGIYSPNSIAWMTLDIAIMNYVGISVGFSKDWAGDNLDYAIRKCDVACLFYSKSLENNVNTVKDAHPETEFICIEDKLDDMIKAGKEMCKELFTLEPVNEDKPVRIVFTSGSTSFPKAVMLSIKNIFSSYEALGRRVLLNEKDICYLFLPLNHTYGAVFNFLYSLVFGFNIYLTGDIKNMAQEMMAVKPTVFCAVPLICNRFYAASKEMDVPLKNLFGGELKYMFVGGSILPDDIRQVYIDQGIYMMNAYALSETSSGFAIDYPGETDMKSAGTILEYSNVKIFDPDKDGIGELAIKGPNVFHGYYADPEATAKVFKDGYFLTGDLGQIVDNKIYIKGRKDTMLVLANGENVSSKRINDTVKEADEKISAVKSYIRDGILMCDIFVKAEDMDNDWQAVIDYVNDNLSKYEKIRKFNVRDIVGLVKG